MELKITGDVKETLQTAANKIADAGGAFSGTTKEWEFSLSGVKGRYNIKHDMAIIQITDKPWLVTTEYIEKKIKEYFDNQQ